MANFGFQHQVFKSLDPNPRYKAGSGSRGQIWRGSQRIQIRKKQCFLRYDFKRFYIEKQVMYSRYPKSFSSSSLPTKIGQLFWVYKGTRQNCHSTFPWGAAFLYYLTAQAPPEPTAARWSRDHTGHAHGRPEHQGDLLPKYCGKYVQSDVCARYMGSK